MDKTPQGCLKFDVKIVLFIAFFFFRRSSKKSKAMVNDELVELYHSATHETHHISPNNPTCIQYSETAVGFESKKRKAIYRIRNRVNIICAL